MMKVKFSIFINVLLILLVVMLIKSNQINVATIDLLQDEVNILTEHKSLATDLKSGNKVELEVCSTSSFKSYMPYRAITDKSSKQFELQQYATTESAYGLRMLDDYFMIAVTSQYGNVGDLLEIELESGWLLAVIGDIKGSGHDSCQSLNDGSVIEFIIDSQALHSDIKYHGNLNILFQGSIKSIYNLGNYQ